MPNREPDRYNEHGQDAKPPSLEEKAYDRDMTPGADDGVSQLWAPYVRAVLPLEDEDHAS